MDETRVGVAGARSAFQHQQMINASAAAAAAAAATSNAYAPLAEGTTAAASAAAPCLFVYNVPAETDETYLYHMFSPYGTVTHVKVRSRPARPQRTARRAVD